MALNDPHCNENFSFSDSGIVTSPTVFLESFRTHNGQNNHSNDNNFRQGECSGNAGNKPGPDSLPGYFDYYASIPNAHPAGLFYEEKLAGFSVGHLVDDGMTGVRQYVLVEYPRSLKDVD